MHLRLSEHTYPSPPASGNTSTCIGAFRHYTALSECFCGGVWNSDKFPHTKENPCRASIAEICCPECGRVCKPLPASSKRSFAGGEVTMEDHSRRWSLNINVKILFPSEKTSLCPELLYRFLSTNHFHHKLLLSVWSCKKNNKKNKWRFWGCETSIH